MMIMVKRENEKREKMGNKVEAKENLKRKFVFMSGINPRKLINQLIHFKQCKSKRKVKNNKLKLKLNKE